DIGRVLVSPRTFFVEQAEAEGKKAPLAALLALTLLVTIGGAIGNLAATGQFEGKQSIGLFQIPCSLAYTWVVYIASAFLVGGVVHGVSCALGGKGTFDGTFRAVTYSWVPSTVVAIVASPFLVRSASEMEKLGRPPTQLPIQSSAPSATWTTSRSGAPRLVWIRPPVAPAPALLLQRRAPASGAQIQKVLELFLGMVPALVLMGLGCLWGFVLLCLGVAEIHGLGGGSAFGAVLLSAVILGLLGGGVGLALATVLGAALQSAAGGLGK
ncbi:MAG: hypothetical protein FJX77_07170, partial [Armatimonadetes bacterium]|nr:hypothetical protein [Armatimonadota bacterium]